MLAWKECLEGGHVLMLSTLRLNDVNLLQLPAECFVEYQLRAQESVPACRYAPLGRREMSLGRAIGYDISGLQRYLDEANDRLLLVIMIESPEALVNVREIAAVPGIDVKHMGTADLTHAMGLTIGEDNPQIDEAIERVLAAGKQYGVAVGMPTEDPDDVAVWTARGMRYFEADTPDYFLRNHGARREDRLRSIFRRVSLLIHRRRSDSVGRTSGRSVPEKQITVSSESLPGVRTNGLPEVSAIRNARSDPAIQIDDWIASQFVSNAGSLARRQILWDNAS